MCQESMRSIREEELLPLFHRRMNQTVMMQRQATTTFGEFQMRYRLIASTAVMAGLFFTPQLRAGEWVTVATACVPDEDTAGRYQADFGRFQFLGNNTGNIGARCNVTNPNDSLLSHDRSFSCSQTFSSLTASI